MEFFRKTCGGRIEELTGKKPALVKSDIYLRSLGLYRVAELEFMASRYIMNRTFPPLVMAEIMLTWLFLATNRTSGVCPFGANPLTRFAPV